MQKTLNEHLGPMRRFLRSRVGRPWNKVHQELCEFVSFDNAVQKHILAHVFEYVHRDVDVRGEQVIPRTGWRKGVALGVGQMFICPRSGLLKVVRPCRSRRQATRLTTSQGHLLLLRAGNWWEVRVRKRDEVVSGYWDVWLEAPVERLSPERCREEYGDAVFAVSARPLSGPERRAVHERIRKSERPRHRHAPWRPKACPE